MSLLFSLVLVDVDALLPDSPGTGGRSVLALVMLPVMLVSDG
jgi:hypothetical protein